MCAGLLELRFSFGINQRRRDIWKRVTGIAVRGMTLRFNENRPTGVETAQRVVETAGNSNEFGRHGAIEVRSPKLCRALKRPILVQDDTLVDESGPRQKIGEPCIGTAVFGEVHHSSAHALR